MRPLTGSKFKLPEKNLIKLNPIKQNSTFNFKIKSNQISNNSTMTSFLRNKDNW